MQSKSKHLLSSRLQTVLEKWTAGETAVLHHFWHEMKAQGTPLIEPITQDDENYLVTFLWRDEGRTLDTICLTEGPAGFDFHLGQMTRLADTDIWFRSYQMPGDTVMLYHLSPNNPLPVWGSPEMNLHGLAHDTRSPASTGRLIRQFVESERLPLRFHLDVGSYDFNGQPELHSNILMANRHLRDVLQAKGYELDYVEFSGGHDFVGWRRALPAAIRWLLENAMN